MNALISDLVARFSGESFNRLNAAQAVDKAQKLAMPRLLELRQVEMGRGAVLVAEGDEARRDDMAEADRQAQEVIDRGARGEVDLIEVRDKGARIVAWLARVKALAADYGLTAEHSAGNVLEAIKYRVQVIDRELQQRYRAEGEPAGAVALRSEISKAKAAAWPLTKALKEARERSQQVGLALGEADVMAAHAELAAADRVVQDLRKRLRDEFALDG